MMIKETIFVDRFPVCKILVSSDSRDLAFLFEPAKPPSRLHKRIWPNIKELREAIVAAYKDPGKDQASMEAGT